MRTLLVARAVAFVIPLAVVALLAREDLLWDGQPDHNPNWAEWGAGGVPAESPAGSRSI